MSADKHTVARRPSAVYDMMDELVKKHHDHLASAKIIIVWRSGWKSDKDGKLVLGKCKKASDYDQALYGDHDFAIFLNEDSWAVFEDDKRAALVDHELSHAGITVTKKGVVKWRIKKHDVEEFGAIIERHGIWKDDLRRFAEKMIAAAKEKPGLFDGGGSVDGEKVTISVNGGPEVPLNLDKLKERLEADAGEPPATVPMPSAARKNGSSGGKRKGKK